MELPPGYATFSRACNADGIPLVWLQDVSGFDIGVEADECAPADAEVADFVVGASDESSSNDSDSGGGPRAPAAAGDRTPRGD